MNNSKPTLDTTASGVGVIDKSVHILTALQVGPMDLENLTIATDLPRATTHRLANALLAHGLLERDASNRYQLGPRLAQLHSARSGNDLGLYAPAILQDLRDSTQESAQLYRRTGNERECIAVSELPSGLRDTVPLGARLPLEAGSAAQVLLAWQSHPEFFSTTALAKVREQGWAATFGERQTGVASVSAPVFAKGDVVIAAVSISGPEARIRSKEIGQLADRVRQAAAELTERLD